MKSDSKSDENQFDPGDTTDREFSAERVFQAPRELVFKAWSSPEHIAEWWGPDGFTTTTHAMDFRPGGQWRFVMHGPDGTDYDNLVTYLAIEEPERIVYDHGTAEQPAWFRVIVTFTGEEKGTRLRMRQIFPTTEERDEVVEKFGAIEGLRQTLDRLVAFVEKIEAGNRK